MAVRCNLSRILGERRIKLTAFAKMAGVAQNTVLSLYHEKAKGVTFDVLDKICDALECQPGELFEHIPPIVVQLVQKQDGFTARIVRHVARFSKLNPEIMESVKNQDAFSVASALSVLPGSKSELIEFLGLKGSSADYRFIDADGRELFVD